MVSGPRSVAHLAGLDRQLLAASRVPKITTQVGDLTTAATAATIAARPALGSDALTGGLGTRSVAHLAGLDRQLLAASRVPKITTQVGDLTTAATAAATAARTTNLAAVNDFGWPPRFSNWVSTLNFDALLERSTGLVIEVGDSAPRRQFLGFDTHRDFVRGRHEELVRRLAGEPRPWLLLSRREVRGRLWLASEMQRRGYDVTCTFDDSAVQWSEEAPADEAPAAGTDSRRHACHDPCDADGVRGHALGMRSGPPVCRRGRHRRCSRSCFTSRSIPHI